ncbi:MAG: hypothetical protein ACLFR8_03150 [Alkalispirochaeta sp.]
MFENILGLERVCADLRRDISAQQLPRAILLAGPRYNGKSSVALEIARAVSCHEDASWNCTCHACSLHRTLQHPNTLLLGPRYFSLEVHAAIDAFRNQPRIGTAYLVIRSVRKLTRRFDQHLWSDARNKKTLPLVENLERLLIEFEEVDGVLSGSGTIDLSGTTGLLDDIGKEVLRLEHAVPHDPVPVDLVRSIAAWARLTSAAGPRVVIIEEAHSLQEGARNAMLKTLEEPPDNTFFILTSSRRSAIIPTIRSRLRIYEVPERPSDIQRDVQQKIFRREEAVPSLREFFRGQGADGDDDWTPLARDLVAAFERGSSTTPVEHRLRDLLGRVSPRHGAEYFLDALEEEIRLRLRSDDEEQIPPAVLVRWGEIIGRYWSRIDSRNMSPPAVLAGAILAMQAAAAAR